MHIAIAGNIGSGKSTLTSLLAKHYKWDAHYEDVENNPYLADFYDNMIRWSFHLQIYFLNSRFSQVQEIREGGKAVIQDRTIYEDAYIFAPNLHSMGLMSSKDYNNYLNLFNLMVKFVPPPDLLIYLKATVPTLVNQIQHRGRDYENTIRIDYLKHLNDRYEEWVDGYQSGKLLVLEVDTLNFRDKKEDLGIVIEKVDALLHGLF